ncbi:hypothetical protein GJ744_001699 [Endocarpon pusillum]|uniref:Uncharacterized protein n=1 Tax=Endocarpon pusillum TaxID=364733 RepID=A0A8H7A9U3_9EURO|nr:hypothetical protein GJ744_001699 [Endocarpon pusillum]
MQSQDKPSRASHRTGVCLTLQLPNKSYEPFVPLPRTSRTPSKSHLRSDEQTLVTRIRRRSLRQDRIFQRAKIGTDHASTPPEKGEGFAMKR